MDSVLNSNPTPQQEETSEQPKHKIWSPIPRKLRKVEDCNFEIHAVPTNNDDSPISAKDGKESFKAYNPKASAFRKIFIDCNNDNDRPFNTKLISSHSGVSNSDAASILTADTLNSEKSTPAQIQHDPFVSVFYRNTPKFSIINTDHDSPFGKPSKQLETPKFRINFGTLSEISPNNTQNKKHNMFSEYLSKTQEPLSQSFLPDGYLQLFSNMIKTGSDCPTPNEEKEEHKRADKCDHSSNNENNSEKITKFLKPNISKKKSRHCNCRNSKCLKLYCECLAYGEYCDDRCNCCDCHNNTKKEEARSYALSLIMEKKPEILEAATMKKQNSSKIVRGKGCNCKKSACLKKYCECFNSGAGCGPECKCEGCKNPHAKPEGMDSTRSIDTCSPISPDITQGLGLTLKEKSFSELDPHLQSLRLGKNKPLLNRGISEKSTDGFPALPLFSLENRL